jgi:hypothetical protein
MDQRQARRLIARWAAAACRSLSDEELRSHTPADRRRLNRARDDLVTELEVRGGALRPPKQQPHDPNQTTLWEDL